MLMSQLEVARYVEQIDRERGRLRKMLLSKNPTLLSRRPPSGDWSIIENVRHLLWAEQRHLGRFLPGPVQWSRVGMTGFRGREFADVGTKPTANLEEVFTEWDEIHKSVRRAVKSATGDVAAALTGNHKHLLYHINIIEKLLVRNAP
jgi:hypothetical protein